MFRICEGCLRMIILARIINILFRNVSSLQKEHVVVVVVVVVVVIIILMCVGNIERYVFY